MQMVDTIVVGAGPAGAAAARTLALAGRETVLADKATFPRDKICGDGLTTLCLRELICRSRKVQMAGRDRKCTKC